MAVERSLPGSFTFRRVVCGEEAIHSVGLSAQLRLDIGTNNDNGCASDKDGKASGIAARNGASS